MENWKVPKVRSFWLSIIFGIGALLLWLFKGIPAIQESFRRLFDVFIPTSYLWIFILFIVLPVVIFGEQLARRDQSLLSDMVKPLHFPKGSARRQFMWFFLIVLPLIGAALLYRSWNRLYSLPFSDAKVRIFVDRFNVSGSDSLELARSVRDALTKELELFLPEAKVELMPLPPEHIGKGEETRAWACASGAHLVIYGTGGLRAIWPNVAICSKTVPGRTFEEYETAISYRDVISERAQEWKFSYKNVPTLDAVRLCMFDSLLPRRTNYLTLFSLGLILYFEDIPGLTRKEQLERAQKLFAKAVELEKGKSNCNLDYCEALFFLGATNTLLMFEDIDLTKKQRLFEQADVSLAEATRIRPDFSDAYFVWGIICSRNSMLKGGEDKIRRLEEAIDKMARAARLTKSPDYFYYWGVYLSGLAIEYYERGSHEKAKKCYENLFVVLDSTVQLNPKSHEAFELWGDALSVYSILFLKGDNQTKSLERCFEKYSKVVQLNSNCYNSYEDWGMALYSLAITLPDERAESILTESSKKFYYATRIKPNYFDAYFGWGKTLLRNATIIKDDNEAGKLYSLASKNFSKAAKIRSNEYEVYFNLGISLSGYAEHLKGNGARRIFDESFRMFSIADSLKAGDLSINLAWGNSLSYYAVQMERREGLKAFHELLPSVLFSSFSKARRLYHFFQLEFCSSILFFVFKPQQGYTGN